MTETTSNATVNRKKVLWTTLMVPLAVPITGLVISFTDQYGFGFQGPLEFFFMFAILGLTYGAIFWIPAVILCLVVEAGTIGNNATQSNVIVAFLIESVLAIGIISYILNDGFLNMGGWPVATGIIFTQGIRWWYLKHKNRMFLNAKISESDAILDDTDL